MKIILALLLMLFSTPALGQESNFALVKLPRGIQIQIPKNWWLIGYELNQAIETSVEAAMDLSGMGLSKGKEINLIAANSMPKTTYAAVSVGSTMPSSISPQELALATPADLKSLEVEIHMSLKKLLQIQGSQLMDFYGMRRENISGYPVLVTNYRRTGPQGSVIVQGNRIFTQNQAIHINFSYRESEGGLWKPIIEKMRQSIVISRWP